MRRTFPLLLLATACARGPTPASSTTPEVTPAAAVETGPAADDSVCPRVDFPDTAAGRRLEDLIAAINAPDDSAAEEFVSTALTEDFAVERPHEQHVQFIRGMHGDGPSVGLCRVEWSVADEVVAILGGPAADGSPEYGRFILAVDGSGKVASMGIEPAAKGDLAAAIVKLDGDAVGKAVDAVADGLAGYVFADKAAAMANAIREARNAGSYAGVGNGHALARRLTDDLVAVSGDKHLGVVYSASVLPPRESRWEPTPEEVEAAKERAARDNFGFPVAEIRDGNVGYLMVLGFAPPELSADAVAETMSKLAEADVLIIDLRQNGGGSPHGVALVTSYLFGNKPVHLNDIYNRSKNSTESFHTSPDVPGRKFGPKKPVYVLTSARTFSAAEEFSYNLQARKRATIVGETTGGGAHPTDFVRASDHWAIALPTARAINPVTKTNWEGVGVKPDVEVPADHALDKALELAKKHEKQRSGWVDER